MNAVEQLAAFDWKTPDYKPIWAARVESLRRLRERPDTLPAVKEHYAANIADFIVDWGVTVDPRNALQQPPREVLMPFVLFPRQKDWVRWVLELARNRESGLTEKSRDCGVSWLAMCTAVSLCLFNRNLTIGCGSAKEDKIDRSGDPDCLFWKARTFLKHLPPEFRGTWDEAKHSAHMRLVFPDTACAITGEAGDQIGRGGRSSIYFVDEAAFLERPKLVEASLASNTDCRIDVSSVSGMSNPFAEKRHSGRVKVFTFHWRDDPRKGLEWYETQRQRLDPVTLAAEVDLDYRASVEGGLIPGAWIQSAVGALERLEAKPSGVRLGALDIADEGRDKLAFAGRYGQQLEVLQSWPGAGSDIYASVQRAFSLCDGHGYANLRFDADGLGAGARGDARVINDQRAVLGQRTIATEAYRGSEGPPDGMLVQGRKNADFFANRKAFSWWALRLRFQATHRAVTEGGPFNIDDIISLRKDLPELQELLQELSQPTYSLNNAGKVVVDKTPPGFKSPNLADAVCIAFAPIPKLQPARWLQVHSIFDR